MSMMQPNPGAVSGPGALSQRTDIPSQGAKKLPDAAYGEQQEFQNIQGAARLAKSNNPLADVVPINADTRRPEEFGTTGANMGPGAGREILGLPTATDRQLEDLNMLAKYMPLMTQYSEQAQSSGTMKSFIKYLRSQIE